MCRTRRWLCHYGCTIPLCQDAWGFMKHSNMSGSGSWEVRLVWSCVFFRHKPNLWNRVETGRSLSLLPSVNHTRPVWGLSCCCFTWMITGLWFERNPTSGLTKLFLNSTEYIRVKPENKPVLPVLVKLMFSSTLRGFQSYMMRLSLGYITAHHFIRG